MIEVNDWRGLIESGQFHAEKALQSLEATSSAFLSSSSHQSVIEVFQNPTASVATVKKYRGEERMLAMVESLIKRTIAFVNVGRGMNEPQVRMTAELIAEKYYYLTVADLKVCFRQGMTGAYGQLFDRIDGMIFLGWLEQYEKERAAVAENISHKAHEETKGGGMFMPDYVKLLMDKIGKKDEAPKRRTGFATLIAFLEHIGRGKEEHKLALLDKWRDEYNSEGGIELKEYLRYRSNQLLYTVNRGDVTDWEGVMKETGLK